MYRILNNRATPILKSNLLGGATYQKIIIWEAEELI